MAKQKYYPTYAVIAAASPDWLERKAREIHHELLPSCQYDELLYDWQVVSGVKNHSAVWDFDPAGDMAWELAPLLSAQIKGKVYLAQLHEHTRGSYEYEEGKALGEIPEDPEKLAYRLGVPFPEHDV
jgi:hypothetical protein